MSYPDNDIRIAGLLRERDALASQGKDGHVTAESAEDKAAHVRKQPPQGRSTKPQTTGE